MAAVAFASDNLSNSVGINGLKWEGLNTTDTTGTPIYISRKTDRSVQIGGTFGGGTVTIEGSNDGTTYFTLNDLQGSAISKTAAALEGVAEVVKWIRPKVTGGDGTTDIDVYLVAVGKA